MAICGFSTYDTVRLDEENRALAIIDQTKLPGAVKFLFLSKPEDIHEAISSLRVRGAPAIGVAAAIGVYLAALGAETEDFHEFYSRFKTSKEFLASSRPTAVNLFWALDRMERVVIRNENLPVSEIKQLLHDEAVRIHDEDIRVCRALGEYGLSLIHDGDGILTHCNAGSLAAVRYGTALAPLHLGRERGYRFKVYADETRPLLQGARLTAFELTEDGIDTTVICDNMVSSVMKNGWVQAVLVGCDRLAANGDACNKIGTSGVAIIAKHYGIPFYVFAPISTIDMSISDGGQMVIEERSQNEVSEMWYRERMTPDGASIYNPAFDVTQADLLTAIVTEAGVIWPPYRDHLREIFQKK
jgi:methylthioribose-1-phosphate isomerase